MPKIKKERIRTKVDQLNTPCWSCGSPMRIWYPDLKTTREWVICTHCKGTDWRFRTHTQQVYPVINGPFSGGKARDGDYEDYELFNPAGAFGRCVLVHIPSIKL